MVSFAVVYLETTLQEVLIEIKGTLARKVQAQPLIQSLVKFVAWPVNR